MSDVFGLALFIAFGLWWLLLPGSVVRFYSWFHRGKYVAHSFAAYRVMGALWILLLLVVAWSALGRGHFGK
jgi:hypothetical protein